MIKGQIYKKLAQEKETINSSTLHPEKLHWNV